MHRQLTASILAAVCAGMLLVLPGRCEDINSQSLLAMRPQCVVTDENPICVTPTMNETLELIESESFQVAFKEIVAEAHNHLREIAPASSKVVLVDLDETLVSNVPFWKKVGEYNKTCWSAWMRTPKVNYYNQAVYDLVTDAKSKGFSVMFVTGRSANDSQFTMRDLGDIQWDGVYFRPEGNSVRSKEYKAKVRDLIRSLGYQIVLNLGDQESDFDLPVQKAEGEYLLPNLIYAIP